MKVKIARRCNHVETVEVRDDMPTGVLASSEARLCAECASIVEKTRAWAPGLWGFFRDLEVLSIATGPKINYKARELLKRIAE